MGQKEYDEEKVPAVKEQEAKPMVAPKLEGEALATHLLAKWNLSNKWESMKENEWDDPKYWKDLIEDADELKACGLKGGSKAKFIGNVKEWMEDDGPVSAKKRKLLKLRDKYELISL